jgi:hypothetical protein
VWLDWRRSSVNLYLGQRLAVLQSGLDPSVVVEFDVATPAATILRRVSAQLKTLPESTFSGHLRCHVWLSGALCPAIPVTFPQGLQGWRERQRYGQSLAAEAMGLDAETIAFELVDGSECIAAAMANGLRDTLSTWAQEQGLRMGSLSPLWSVATRIAEKANALLFAEPDAVSAFALNNTGSMVAKTWPTAMLSDVRATANRWLATTALIETTVKRAKFSASGDSAAKVPDSIPLNRHWVLE